MGDCCGCCSFPRRNNNRKIVLLLVGLDNAGKTTAAKGLVGEFVKDAIPTVGFSSITLKHRGYSVVIYDLGGGTQIRPLWNSYFADVHGIIFVMDASDVSRIEECKFEIEKLLRNEKLAGKPVLLLANKQDLRGALDEIDIVEVLKLEQLVNEQKCITLVEVCSSKPPTTRRKKIDQRLLNGYRWLLNQIIHDYASLNPRVEYDMKEESVRIEQQRALWRQRMKESTDGDDTSIPENTRNGDLQNTEHNSPNHITEWAHRNGNTEHKPDGTSPIKDLDSSSITRVIKEQLERKSARQRHKMTLVRRNKVQPLNDKDATEPYPRGEEPSLILQALTSPRKRLPPLRGPKRPSTSKSLGNEGTAWDLHKELEVVDVTQLDYNSDEPHSSNHEELF